MAGKPLALTDRDKRILAEVQRFGAITRAQLVRLSLFSSKTRANERLRRLTRAGYLVARPLPLVAGGPRFVYAPGPQLSGHSGTRTRLHEVSDLFVSHQLGLVDIRLAFEHHTTLTRWLADRELSPLKLGLIPDAYLEYEQAGRAYSAFVEYDRGTESLGRLEAKVRSYIDLAFSGRFERQFSRRFFHALFVTESAGRLATISRATARLTDKVVRLATLADVIAHGPTAIIWRRPGAAVSSESLTHE